MKKFLLILLSSIFLSSNVYALKLDIQVERTPQAPGYLAFTIFPPKDLSSLKVLSLEEVYVKNYAFEEEERYKDLLQLIQEFGGKIVPAIQADQWYQKPYTRVIILGDAEDINGDAQFIPQKGKDEMTEDFVTFASDNLQPTYLQSVSIIGDDNNFVDSFPQEVNFFGDKPIRFIGKFKEERDMKVVLQAIGADDILQAKINVDLANTNLHNSDLPELWEDLQRAENPVNTNNFWFNVFPFILGIIGLLCLGLAFSLKKKEDKSEESLNAMVYRLRESIDDETLPFDLDHHSREQTHKPRDKKD